MLVDFLDRTKDFIIKYKLTNLLMVIVAYYSICDQGSLGSYDLNSWLIFFSLIVLFLKTEVKKKYKKITIFFSAFFSFLFVFGKVIYNFQTVSNINIFKEIFHFKYLIYYLGTFSIIFFLLCYLIPFLFKDIKVKRKKVENKTFKKVFITSFLFIFISWIPYFLSYYPGLLTQDSFHSVRMAVINGYPLSNHHPMTYSTTVIILVNIGLKIFKNLTAAIAFDTVFQMMVMASIFSYCIVYCYRLKQNKKLIAVMLVSYALLPVFGFYSITMWKDVMFSGFILLLTIQTFNMIKQDERNNISLRTLIPFIIISLLCLLFRNNAIYMYILYMVVMLCTFKKHLKTFLLSFVIILSVYFFIQGPVFKYFKVQKTESAEYISIPLQMMGRMVYKEREINFTKEEKQLINELIQFDVLKKIYNPRSCDNIKAHPKFNAKIFDKNKSKYYKLWLLLALKHPSVALESFFNSNLGYWYPNISYWAAATSTYPDNKLGIKNTAVSHNIKDMTLYFESRNTPILSIEWSIGLYFWFILILLYVTIKKYGYKILSVYTPVIGIWITLIMAAPVFGEFRYIFSAVTSLPFYIFINYSKEKKRK